VTLDRTLVTELSRTSHKTASQLKTINNLLMKLAAVALIITTSSRLLCLSASHYCAAVWSRLAHKIRSMHSWTPPYILSTVLSLNICPMATGSCKHWTVYSRKENHWWK